MSASRLFVKSAPLPELAQWLPRGRRIALEAVAAAALVISAYLVYMKWTGQISSLHGCGGGEGCANLLGGRWGTWMRVPLSVWAMLSYAGLLALCAWGLTSGLRITLAVFCGLLLFSAAIWFVGLQALVEHHFCFYCGLLHACGLIIFGILIQRVLTHGVPGRPAALRTAVAANAVAISALILGQIWGPQPDTHQITEAAAAEIGPTAPGIVAKTSESAPARAASPTQTRTVSYLDGHVRYTLGEVPLLGDPTAEHILVEYFDYTCPGCREFHQELEKAVKLYPNKFATIVIPTPLNRGCNPYVPSSIKTHAGACELARLGLAVWHANPDKFSAFHETLFREQGHISVSQARQFAAELVGENALAQAERDPSIAGALNQAFSIYRVLSRSDPRLPKLLLGGKRLMNGIPRDTATLVKLLKEAFSLG